MSLDSSALSYLARSKLHLSTSSKNYYNLHRWVLLKNSILASPSNITVQPAHPQPHEDTDNDDDGFHEEGLAEIDAFMFPDAGQLVPNSTVEDFRNPEAHWLDSLLDELGDDEGDDGDHSHSEIYPYPLPIDDQESPLSTPGSSPISLSEDLSSTHSSGYSSPGSVSATIYSVASSRTASTDYGFFYTRHAPSNYSFEGHQWWADFEDSDPDIDVGNFLEP